jgi:uncharacterized protein (TIGR01244 family)
MGRNQSKPLGAGLISAGLLALAALTGTYAWGDEMFSQQSAKVDDRVVVAGLLDLEALERAHGKDVLIVDLRTEGEGAPQEAESAAAHGFAYANIPVSSATVDPDQVETLKMKLAGADPEAVVVVHCVSGNRAGMLWGAAALTEGASLESVKQSLDGVLNKQPAIDGLENFAQTLNAQR